MRTLSRRIAAVAFVASSAVAPDFASAKEQLGIARFFPQRLIRGRAHTVEIQGTGLQVLQAIEISPPDGISVALPAQPSSNRKSMQRWSVVLTVDAAAAPGSRTVILVTPAGRTTPVTITIPDHQPVIADLKVELVQRSPLIVAFTVAVSDEKGDLGETPQTFSQLACKNGATDSVANGVITQRSSDTSLTLSSAYLDYQAKATAGDCRLMVSALDTEGNQSNWLEATVTFR